MWQFYPLMAFLGELSLQLPKDLCPAIEGFIIYTREDCKLLLQQSNMQCDSRQKDVLGKPDTGGQVPSS